MRSLSMRIPDGPVSNRVLKGAVVVSLAFWLAPASGIAQFFSDWDEPAALETVNTVFGELNPTISKDGLSLYFQSNRPNGFGGTDIWVSERAAVTDDWGAPQNLGPAINTSANEAAPTLSIDGHRMYFQSDRADPDSFGGLDIYLTRRHNKRDSHGWQPPANLGGGVNTTFNENGPAYFEDDDTGAIELYFNSNRPGGSGGTDIYVSTLGPDDVFGPAVPVAALNSPENEGRLAIRRDGLELLLTSARAGGYGNVDLWVSVRGSTSSPWGPPVNLGPTINSGFIEQGPAFSFDARELYFTSQRPGADLFRATRTKLTGAR